MSDNDATQTRRDDAIDDALIQIADWYHDHLSEYAEECEIDEYGGLYWVIGRDVSDDLDNLIIKAQNLAATLGAGTCTLINAADDLGSGTSSSMCFECGYTALDDWWEEFNFCPNCGRKVVEE